VDHTRVLFAAGIDIGHKHRIRIAEAGDVFAEERLCAGVAVALEHAVQLVVRHAGCSIERCADLTRVMTVIVEITDAVALAVVFKAALRVGEAFHGLRKCGEGYAEFIRNDECRDGIEHVVQTGNGKLYSAEGISVVLDGEGGAAHLVEHDVRGTVAAAVQTVGLAAVREFVDQALDALVVRAADEQAVLGQSGEEFFKRLYDVVDILVVVEVIIVDVVDERHGRCEGQEAFDVFAGFGDEGAVVADAHTAAQQVNIAADVDGCVPVRRGVDVRKHGGDGGLAVAARDGDDGIIALGDLAQGDAALELGDAEFLCHLALGVIGFDRGAVDDKIRVLNIFTGVSHGEGDAGLIKRVGKLRAFAVAARDLVTLGLQDQREAVHAAAADTDEMDSFCVIDLCHNRSFAFASAGFLTNILYVQFGVHASPCHLSRVAGYGMITNKDNI